MTAYRPIRSLVFPSYLNLHKRRLLAVIGLWTGYLRLLLCPS